MKSFLITGMGRSGTQFLANTLNKSSTWTVTHEHSNDSDYLMPGYGKTPIRRFEGSCYGEVNSQLRRVAPNLERLGVNIILIKRDPKDILRSVMQARGWKRDIFPEAVHLIRKGIEQVVRLQDDPRTGKHRISFENLIAKPWSLAWDALFSFTGITDLKFFDIDFSKKVGSNGEDFPLPGHFDWTDEEKLIFSEDLGYFTERLGYNGYCNEY